MERATKARRSNSQQTPTAKGNCKRSRTSASSQRLRRERSQSGKHTLKQQREALSDCSETSNLSQTFTTDELINALKATKAGKAAGPDGIFPHMLKNIGPTAIRWLQAFYDDVVTTANIPKKHGDQQM